MTPQRYRDALAHLGLTQVGAARLFGVDDRTSRRWAKRGLHGTADTLLRLLLSQKVTQDDIHFARRYRTGWPTALVRRTG